MNYPLRLTSETLAMLMIGDGVLMMLQPRRHVTLWDAGPEAWRKMIGYFEDRPALTMGLGALQAAAGVWLASRQSAPQIGG
ncbi:MAG: hypothetical protein ACT4OF_10215 [Caulobacteraceae bacterium]